MFSYLWLILSDADEFSKFWAANRANLARGVSMGLGALLTSGVLTAPGGPFVGRLGWWVGLVGIIVGPFIKAGDKTPTGAALNAAIVEARVEAQPGTPVVAVVQKPDDEPMVPKT